MKLHWSPRSPQVRKIMIIAHELCLVERITCVRTVVDPLTPNAALMTENPLSKIPTLVTDEGDVLYDSPVIAAYLDTMHDGPRLIPEQATQRWTALRRQALGDGFVEFLLHLRNEIARAHPSQTLIEAFNSKRKAVLDTLEQETSELAVAPFTIGHIAIGGALSYLDFRFPDHDWRSGRAQLARWHESFSARPSVRATKFVDDE